MSFANPNMLWLLLVFPPALLLFFWWSQRTRQRLAQQFIQARLLPGLVKGVSVTRQKIRAGCLVAAVVCLVLTLARPQWGYELEEVTQRGLDIVVAIDTSKSMLADDIAPNRLARARLAALDLMKQAKSDRLGLVAFAGRAFLQCPLTVDDSAFRQSVEALDVNIIPEGGTALADAIDTALTAFKEGDSHKALVLFTDGEDHDSGALDAAKRAAEAGMQIYTIGIGSPEGELLRVKNENGQMDYVRNAQGEVVKSRLNQDLLEQIAKATPEGFYLPLRGANTIDTLYQQGLSRLPKSDAKEQWVRRAHEQYHWPLALALVLLTVEIFFPERKRETRKAAALKPLPAGAAVIALLLALSAGASASPSSALRDYQSGNYDDALKQYEDLLQRRGDPRLHFNAGAAAYRNRQYDDAARHFDEALRSPDLQLQARAYYNRGNALYQRGESNADSKQKTADWEKSLKDYESTLKLFPEDPDAKFNHEFVKKRIEELKQQQQQQQNSQDQDQKKNDDQQQQNQQNNQSNQNNQQQKSDSQKDQEQKDQQQQQAQDKKQSEEDRKKQQEEQQKKEQQKQDEAEKKEQPQPVSDQEKKTDEQKDQGEAARAYAAGEMTPEQAHQLLDAQKNNEKVLPFTPEKRRAQPAQVKDW